MTARARTRTKAQQQRVERCHRLGRERLHAAESVFTLDAGPRLSLLRDAATCFIGALLVDGDEGADVDALEAPAAWERLQAKIDEGVLPRPPPAVLAARRWLVDGKPLDPPGPGESSDALDAAFAAVRWLRERCDPRARWSARTARTLGAVVLALALATSVAGLVAMALAPRDLALGKKVTSSTQPEKSNRRPAGLTNGSLELSFGAETKEEDAPWFVVDLGEPTAIDRVVVYNRGDHEGDGNVPLALDVGEALDAMDTVGMRSTPFTRGDPWIVRGLQRTARYVRVRRTTKGPLVLDEIEVYR